MSDEERCREAKTLGRIDEAFRAGNLDLLRAAVDDPSLIPNGQMPVTVGSCLVYAIYWSPLSFVRELLEMGADPTQPADDGFPPLIAALSTSSTVPGANTRSDVNDLVRLLLRFGADPAQRGLNDWTALHMAVNQRNALAVQLLLESGADPDLRTRIDDCDTPLEMARAANIEEIAAILERRGQPIGRRLRSGLTLLVDIQGHGDEVRRQHRYEVTLRFWLNRGEAVRWEPVSLGTRQRIEDGGEQLRTIVRIDRVSLINGLFYGVEGMRVGGTRRLQIAPHLAYGEQGLPGRVPPHALLTVEITIVASIDRSADD